MNNKQIFRKAVERATTNGYYWSGKMTPEEYDDKGGVPIVIFSHGFATAFWGEKKIRKFEMCYLEAWKYHLQQMVLESEPLKYLEKFL